MADTCPTCNNPLFEIRRRVTDRPMLVCVECRNYRRSMADAPTSLPDDVKFGIDWPKKH
jgi:uncharacterized protein YbaR (Trm112 family)